MATAKSFSLKDVIDEKLCRMRVLASRIKLLEVVTSSMAQDMEVLREDNWEAWTEMYHPWYRKDLYLEVCRDEVEDLLVEISQLVLEA